MKRLTTAQIRAMHSALVQQTGGTDGIRDEGLLDSALQAPFQSFAGEYAHKSLEAKAARLGYGLIKNHAFVDGNKRIGMLAMLVFLELNGVSLCCTDQEIIDTGLMLASGQMSIKELLSWILARN